MNRREVITLLGGGAASALLWPLAAHTQQAGKIRRIGFLANDPTIPAQPAGQAFIDGLRESGFIEGKNIVVERRFADGWLDRYADLVAELVRLDVDVIVSSSSPATLAAKKATTNIPIIMLNLSDPIGQGIVASLARPGGNITGVVEDDSAQIAAKRLQLLKDAVPRTVYIAVLFSPDLSYSRSQWQQLELAASSLNLKLRQLVARQPGEFGRAFSGVELDRPDGLFVTNSPLNFVNRSLIIELAAKSRLPMMTSWREYTEAGGLMSYASVRADRFKRAAIYVGKILKGARPTDLPVEQPTKYELVINLKTARSLNVDIPRDLLLVADEVIE
jgi:putative ABC transport system substrate-binding protein